MRLDDRMFGWVMLFLLVTELAMLSGIAVYFVYRFVEWVA